MLDAKAYYNRLLKYRDEIKKKIDFEPEVAIVLGSGLGDFAKNIQVEVVLDYGELEGFPVSTAPGHSGQFIFGTLEGVKVVCMKGRIHYYEGYDMSEVVLPLRLMYLLGARTVIITNAVGCMNENFGIGSFMVVRDCIASFVPSPLIGPNIDELGPRFPDMSEIYNKDLRVLLREAADELNITLYEGTYLQTSGPNFETPAEVRFFRSVGADAVGMSTAVETIAANHMGMKICGITFISNPAAGLSKNPLTHEEVQEAANEASKRFKKLVTVAIRKIGKQL